MNGQNNVIVGRSVEVVPDGDTSGVRGILTEFDGKKMEIDFPGSYFYPPGNRHAETFVNRDGKWLRTFPDPMTLNKCFRRSERLYVLHFLEPARS